MADNENKLVIGVDVQTDKLLALQNSMQKTLSSIETLANTSSSALNSKLLGAIEGLTRGLGAFETKLKSVDGLLGALAGKSDNLARSGGILDQHGRPMPASNLGAGSAQTSGGGGGGFSPPPGAPPIGGGPPSSGGGARLDRLMGGGVSGFVGGAIAYMGVQQAIRSVSTAADFASYDYSLSQRALENVGVGEALSGRTYQRLSGQRAIDESFDTSTWKGKGRLGMAALAAFPTALTNPSGFQQKMLEYAKKEGSLNPEFGEAIDYYGKIPGLAGNAEQIYGQPGFLQMMQSGAEFGEAKSSEMIRQMRRYGVMPKNNNIHNALLAKERYGLGSYVDASMRTGTMPTEAGRRIMEQGVVGAGMNTRERFADMEALNNLSAQSAAQSGIIFPKNEDVARYMAQTQSFGGAAANMGLQGDQLRQTALGAQSLTQGFAKTDLAQMLLREKLAEKNIVGGDASTLIEADLFDPRNKDKLNRVMSKIGQTDKKWIRDLTSIPMDTQKQLLKGTGVSSIMNKAIASEFGGVSGSEFAMAGQGAYALHAALNPATTGRGGGLFKADLTTKQEIDAANTRPLAAMLKTVEEAGEIIKRAMSEAGDKLISRIDEGRKSHNMRELQKNLIKSPAINNNGPAKTYGGKGGRI